MITVIDVFKEMRVEPTRDATLAVGIGARQHWVAQYGELPEKRLRTKTYGGGSHCFAMYPEWMREPIKVLIRKYGGERRRQGDLFD